MEEEKSRKGTMSSIPITLILKIVFAILVVSTILAIFIPLIFKGKGVACGMLKKMIDSIPVVGKNLSEFLGLAECGIWIFKRDL